MGSVSDQKKQAGPAPHYDTNFSEGSRKRFTSRLHPRKKMSPPCLQMEGLCRCPCCKKPSISTVLAVGEGCADHLFANGKSWGKPLGLAAQGLKKWDEARWVKSSPTYTIRAYFLSYTPPSCIPPFEPCGKGGCIHPNPPLTPAVFKPPALW